MSFKRKELIDIRNRAEEIANRKGLNPRWSRAYLHLSDAANSIDAIIARTLIQGDVEKVTE